MDLNNNISAHLWNCCSCNSVVTISNHQISSLAFGRNHCLFLTSSKKVFSFGKNSYGQLGTGDLVEHLKEPYHLETLPCNIKSISCGSNVSAVITDDGKVYMWGENGSGQCGLETPGMILTPSVIPIVDAPSCKHNSSKYQYKNKVIQMSCGAFHTLALTASHDIWVWGTGVQLGIQGRKKTPPTKLQFFSNRKVISVACGNNYSLAVLESPTKINEDSKHSNSNNSCDDCNQENSSKCPLGLSMEIGSDLDKNLETCTSNTSVEQLTDFEDRVENQSQILELDEPDLLKPDFSSPVCNESNLSSCQNQIETGRILKFSTPESDLFLKEPSVESNRESVSSEVELRQASSRNLLKRAGSILDPEVAKQYLEKLTDSVCNLKEDVFNSEDTDVQVSEKNEESKVPFVWDVVSKVRNSFDKIQMGSFGKISSGSTIDKSLSQESFEVLETNLVDTEAGSLDNSTENFGQIVKRTGSLKSLLELKQGQKSKEKTRKTSIEAFVTVGRNKGRKKGNDIKSKITKDNQHVAQSEPSVLQTEIWSWGSGQYGQLGHGDELERITPCCVKQLSGQGVIRVLAGHGHSIALTADGRVISWGLNSDGQLGHSFKQKVVLTPKQVELPSNELIWDVATGDTRSIFLVDHRAPRVAMYFCGSHELIEDSMCECPKEEGIHQLNILRKSGLIERVFGGGLYLGCLVNPQGLSELPVLHEFAATERWFLYQLQIVLTKLLSPLLKDSIYSMPALYAEPLKNLIVKLTMIIDMVALNTYDLTLVVLSKGNLDGVNFITNLDDWLEGFLIYSDLLGDVISVNACSSLAKEWSWTPNKLKMLARDTLGEAGLEHKTSAEVLLHLLSMPIRRAREYAKLLNKVSSSNLKFVKDVNLQDLTSKFLSLTDTISFNLKLSEKTKLFWESAPQKFMENYKIPSRRLIRESKSQQLHLQSSGRFSSHWFLLFNDILVHQHFSSSESYPLQIVWVEPLPDTETVKNAFLIRMPEDVLTLFASNSAEKTEWICAFNASIRQLLDNDKDPLSRLRSLSGINNGGNDVRRLSPPLPRQGTYTFQKTPFFKDAIYTGMWLCGKVHGSGTMTWPDNKKYVGKFKQNTLQGEGVMTVPFGDREYVYDGFWKDNKLSGFGTIKYPSGDYYEGYFKDGQRSGHGMLKQGQLIMSAASIYIGQWSYDMRHGYGVLDNIPMGEKYMGMWQDDCKHGKGLVVTIDGIYYEGTFVNDKLQGFGVMMFEDGTFFEGELGPNGTLDGKGVLYLSNGDHIDGSFSGIWSTNFGIKTNGFYHKSTSISSANDIRIAEEKKKWTYGQLCVPASAKWVDIFNMCKDNMGIKEIDHSQDNCKAWEAIAIAVAKHKKGVRNRKRYHYNPTNFDVLERIPKTSSCKGSLLLEDYREIQEYLICASDCLFHPLGQLIENIVDVYRAAYLGIGAHKTLLPHAVSEIEMFTSRTYEIIRILFPDLPEEGDFLAIPLDGSNAQSKIENSTDSEEDTEEEIVSPSSLLHTILLPRLYPPLFTLYALHNEKEDEQYWKRIIKWNRQSDISLMTFLGVHQKFWLMKVVDKDFSDKIKSLSSLKDIYFAPAIEMLQRISTEFSPRDKLKTIHLAFKEINEEVQSGLDEPNFLWNMDDLFPVFQYVVVRARIRHLGSEIHLIGDLMERHYEMGELGIMFTTLKACYFQIRTEKAQTM